MVKQIHPAVKKHFDEIGSLEMAEAIVPNHEQLLPFLLDLPENCNYLVFDPESGGFLNDKKVVRHF